MYLDRNHLHCTQHPDLHQDLEDVSDADGRDWCAFGDAAYPLHRCLHHVLKAPEGGSLNKWQRRYNSLMAKFRVVVEQIFAQKGQQFAFRQHA